MTVWEVEFLTAERGIDGCLCRCGLTVGHITTEKKMIG